MAYPKPAQKSVFRLAISAALASAAVLSGCKQSPSQVSLKLLSPDPVSSKDWSTEKETSEYSASCQMNGTITYGVEIEPKDFTGVVTTKNAIVEIAGKYKYEDESYDAVFVDGKQTSGGISAYQLAFKSQDDKEEYKALCAVKTLDQVKLLSLGKPIIATPGVKLVIKGAKQS